MQFKWKNQLCRKFKFLKNLELREENLFKMITREQLKRKCNGIATIEIRTTQAYSKDNNYF